MSLLASAYAATALSFLQGVVGSVILTRLLPVAEFGVWSQFRAVSSLAATLPSLNLGHGYLRFAPGRPQAARKQLLLLVLTAQTALCLAGFFLLLPWASDAARWLYDSDSPWLVLVVLPAALLTLWQTQLSNTLIAINQPRTAYLLLSAGRIGFIIAIAVAALIAATVESVVLGMLVAASVITAVNTWLVRAELWPLVGFAVPQLKRLIRFCLPLLPVQLSLWICASSDRLFLGHMMDLQAVGRYSLVYSFASTVHILYSAAAGVFLSSLARLYDRGALPEVESSFSMAFRAYWVGGVALVVAISLGSEWAAALIGTKDYVTPEVMAMATWVAIGSFVFGLYQMLSRLYDLEQRSKSIGAIWSMAIVLNLLLNYFLIPRLGMTGAALATAASYGATFGLAVILRPRSFRLAIRVPRLILHGLASIALAYFFAWVLADQDGFTVAAVAAVATLVCGALCGVIKKEDLMAMKGVSKT